jgi:hypothetical protein
VQPALRVLPELGHQPEEIRCGHFAVWSSLGELLLQLYVRQVRSAGALCMSRLYMLLHQC